MSTESNKAFVRRYFEAMGKDKSPANVNRYVAESDQELKDHIAFFEAAFPKYQLSVDDMIAEGDKVAVRTTFTGTHRGDLMGIAPTDKDVVLPFIIIYRVSGDRIVEHWMSVDQMALMQQLGVAPG